MEDFLIWLGDTNQSSQLDKLSSRLNQLAATGYPIARGFCFQSNDLTTAQKQVKQNYQKLADLLNLAQPTVAVSLGEQGQDWLYGHLTRFDPVLGEKAVGTAIEKLWQSYERHQTINRKSQYLANKVPTFLIQHSAEPIKSGVVTTESEIITIKAIWGAIDPLRNGSIEPDKYQLDKSSGQIIEQHVVGQTWQLARLGSRVKVRKIPLIDQAIAKLNEQDLKQLTDLALRLKHHWHGPISFEWRIDETDKIYLDSVLSTQQSMVSEIDSPSILSGSGFVPGQAKGRVKQVKSGQIAGIEPNSILVYQTGQLKFPYGEADNISGLIVSNGRLGEPLLQQANDLDIPTIIGVRQAAYRLPEGLLVNIDGQQGRVYLGEEDNPQVARGKPNHHTHLYTRLGKNKFKPELLNSIDGLSVMSGNDRLVDVSRLIQPLPTFYELSSSTDPVRLKHQLAHIGSLRQEGLTNLQPMIINPHSLDQVRTIHQLAHGLKLTGPDVLNFSVFSGSPLAFLNLEGLAQENLVNSIFLNIDELTANSPDKSYLDTLPAINYATTISQKYGLPIYIYGQRFNDPEKLEHFLEAGVTGLLVEPEEIGAVKSLLFHLEPTLLQARQLNELYV